MLTHAIAKTFWSIFGSLKGAIESALYALRVPETQAINRRLCERDSQEVVLVVVLFVQSLDRSIFYRCGRLVSCA